MDGCLSQHLHRKKICPRSHRRCRNASQSTHPEIKSYHYSGLYFLDALFNSNPGITIIYCYSPTNVSHETDRDTFYNELSSILRIVPKHNVPIIGGNMNAQIGKNVNNEFNLLNSSNRNGEHLTDFKQEKRLSCLNIKFQKRKGKLWKHTYANKAKAQIDYILMNKKWINSTLNCEAYSSFGEMSFDHRIVMAKLRLSPCRNVSPTTKTARYH